MKLSLKIQILFLLSMLVGIILVQSTLTWNARAQLVDSRAELSQAAATVELVLKLERDVLDLQRNLLLYKATGSTSVAERFKRLSQVAYVHLNELSTPAAQSDFQSNGYISRLKTHLDTYSDAFLSVIESKSQQKQIIEDKLKPQFLDVTEKLTIKGASDAQYHLRAAESAVFQYLVEPDFKHLETVRRELARTSDLASEDQELVAMVSDLNGHFVRLTQLTRSYVFLVNVVMAGSANEILFLTKEMLALANTERSLVETKTNVSMAAANTRNNGIAIACIILVTLLAGMINQSIIVPIRKITRVFGKIIAGEQIKKIPGVERDDEIGQLTKAASVFYEHSLAQRRLNQELQVARQKAEDSTRSKSLFLANMSHEIRTPINGVLGLIQLCQKTDLTFTQRDYLAKAVQSGQVLMGVINDVLDFSKIEAGKLEMEEVDFDLDDLMQGAMASAQATASERQINLRLFMDPGLDSSYRGDPLRISQILINLLSNAVKFTEQGCVTVEVKLDTIADTQSDIIFSVQDTGIGMTDTQLKSVFEAFTQADDSTSRKFGGTGLGLSIVNQLVNLMNGKVNVSSSIDQGSRFDVHLRLNKSQWDSDTYDTQDELVNVLFSKSNPGQSISPYLPPNMTFIEISDLKLRPSQSALKQRIVIGVDSIHQAIAMKDDIDQILLEGHYPGFFIDACPLGFRQALLDHFNLPVLEQPATRKDLMAFFLQLSAAGPRQLEEEICYLGETDIQLKGHVLVVEDNSINQAVAVDMLQEYGITCDVADNGLQAVKRIEAGEIYDLILMDVQMPIMDGFEATEAIRKKGFDQIKICGLSANAMKSDINKALEHGMNGYLTKPIDWDALEQTLLEYLPQRDPAQLH